jgi:hypothetical protein
MRVPNFIPRPLARAYTTISKYLIALMGLYGRFVVNIKLAVNRVVPITVHLDKPALEQAQMFAKIHTLDEAAVTVLTSVLQQHIDTKKMHI